MNFLYVDRELVPIITIVSIFALRVRGQRVPNETSISSNYFRNHDDTRGSYWNTCKC